MLSAEAVFVALSLVSAPEQYTEDDGTALLVGCAVSIFYIYIICPFPNLLISLLMTAKTKSKRMLLSGNTKQGEILQSLHDSSSQPDASRFFRPEKSSDYCKVPI